MPFRLYHNDKLIGEFEDAFMESYITQWQTEYVSAKLSLDLETETLKIWVENKRRKNNKNKRPAPKENA